MKLPKIINRSKKAIKAWISESFLTNELDQDNDSKWRSLTQDTTRNLTLSTQDRVIEIAYYLFRNNPLAHRILEITKDFVIGEGATYQADNEADDSVQGVLDAFWNDSINQWDLKQHQKALEIGLFGEQFYPVFVNKFNGHVRLGYIDPAHIKQVITNPDNIEEPIQILLKSQNGEEGKTLNIIREDENGVLNGQVFYFSINKVSSATRGRSDLASLADWLDAYDQLLINRAERSALINAFVWDVTLTGLSEKEIRTYSRNHTTAPRPGSVRFHNDKVKWEAVAPTLNADDATKEARMLKNFILGGAGLPEHWFADGGDANRATAAEMSEPVLKRLQTRQNYFKYMLEFIGKYVIDQAILKQTISPTANTGFTVKMSDLSNRDTKTLSTALKEIVMSTTLAVQSKVMSREEATRLILLVAEGFGDKIDLNKELKKIKLELLDNSQNGN